MASSRKPNLLIRSARLRWLLPGFVEGAQNCCLDSVVVRCGGFEAVEHRPTPRVVRAARNVEMSSWLGLVADKKIVSMRPRACRACLRNRGGPPRLPPQAKSKGWSDGSGLGALDQAGCHSRAPD